MISKAMKLVLTGTSGFIGSEVLSQALHHPSITSIVVLSRKPIPNSDPKLKVVVIDDFEHYSPSVLSELSGAEACIWYVFSFSPPFLIT
jgi:nucleoside-diphosphate-sugar epimerase